MARLNGDGSLDASFSQISIPALALDMVFWVSETAGKTW